MVSASPSTIRFVHIISGESPALPITSSGADFGFRGEQFAFNISGPTGQLVVIEASTDLVSWRPVGTNTIALAGSFWFIDLQNSTLPNHFYRLAGKSNCS